MRLFKYCFSIIVVSSLAAVGTGCNGKGDNKNGQQSDEEVAEMQFPENDIARKEIKDLRNSIIKKDASEFAHNVSYPLQRPYPLHNIEDSAEMVKYFPTLVDDSLVNAVKKASPEQWDSYGWRGWSFSSGEYFWYDGKLYAVNYVSNREREIIDSLRNEDMNTIAPALRKGWLPVLCMRDTANGTLYRIDEETKSEGSEPLYRLAAYPGGNNTNAMPAMLFTGRREVEGTMGNQLYRFKDKNGNKAEFSDYEEDDDAMSITLIKAQGDTIERAVRPVYWLDIVKKQQNSKTPQKPNLKK